MNEHNPPMMLPNGCIYSETALQLMANDDNGFITCPKTTKKYPYEKLTRVFIS